MRDLDSDLAVWVRWGCGDTVARSFGRVAEWQTRWLQVPVSFGTWGFKSPFAHHEEFDELQAQRSRTKKWFVTFVLREGSVMVKVFSIRVGDFRYRDRGEFVSPACALTLDGASDQ